MHIRSRALYHLTAQGEVMTSHADYAFSGEAYSRFKYGSVSDTERFARSLASYVQCILADGDAEPWLLTSAAYKHIPTAAATLTHFLTLTTDRIFEPLRVKRENLFEGEYEKLDADARLLVLQAAGFHLAGTAVCGRKVVVIDDVRITGSHEALLTSLLAAGGATHVLFVYIVRVEAVGCVLDPTLEHRLNSAAICAPEDLLHFIHTQPLLLNARLCKRILLWPPLHALPAFLRKLPDAFVVQVAEAVRAEGYGELTALQPAVAVLEEEARMRETVAV